MYIQVTGDRNWSSREVIEEALEPYSGRVTLVHGNAKGADKLSGEVARERGFAVLKVPADWAKYGRGAGPIRNRQMLDMGPDVVLAFHNDLAKSRGTKDCVKEAIKRGLPVILFTESDTIRDEDEIRKIIYEPK